MEKWQDVVSSQLKAQKKEDDIFQRQIRLQDSLRPYPKPVGFFRNKHCPNCGDKLLKWQSGQDSLRCSNIIYGCPICGYKYAFRHKDF